MSSLDIYRRHDIANVLRATACTSEGAVQMIELNTEQLEAYRKGVRIALVSVGLAFGLEPVRPVVKHGQQPPLVGLLWVEACQNG